MIVPQLKSLMSPDLDEPALPSDPTDCEVFLELEIGSSGSRGADIFSCTVITPAAYGRKKLPSWGRTYLIVHEFNWVIVRQAIENLLMHACRDTWDEVVTALNKELGWEFESYRKD